LSTAGGPPAGGSGGARGQPPRRPPGCARARSAATTLPHLWSTTGGTGRRVRAFGRAHHPLNGNSGGRGRRGLRPRLPEFACGRARLAEFQGAGPPSAQTRASGPGHRIIEGGARSSGTLGAFSKVFSNHPIRPSLTLGYNFVPEEAATMSLSIGIYRSWTSRFRPHTGECRHWSQALLPCRARALCAVDTAP